MEFEKSSLCRVMVFENFIEVGNLSWAVSTLEKTGQKPKTNPPGERSPGGVFFLSGQNFSIRQTVERFPNMSGIIKFPAAD